jgi:hypothetical protein
MSMDKCTCTEYWKANASHFGEKPGNPHAGYCPFGDLPEKKEEFISDEALETKPGATYNPYAVIGHTLKDCVREGCMLSKPQLPPWALADHEQVQDINLKVLDLRDRLARVESAAEIEAQETRRVHDRLSAKLDQVLDAIDLMNDAHDLFETGVERRLAELLAVTKWVAEQ